MLYRLVRPIATAAFITNFKKIYLHNQECIPWEKPIFFAVNHPSAFIEPCLLACFLPQPLYFLVRGDIWGHSFYNKLMRSVNLIPIYRQRDGFTKLTKNFDTFQLCYQALAARKNILAMPEGSTIQVKRLRPIKKGLAKICFGALEATPDLDIHIVPIGANFTQADKPRTEVMLSVGQPIPVRKFWPDYLENPNKAILELTNALETAMADTVISIREPEDEDLVEMLFTIYRNNRRERTFPVYRNTGLRFEEEKMLAATVSNFPENQKSTLKQLAQTYFEKLKANNVKDIALAKDRSSIFQYPIVVIGFIPAILGKYLNYPPIGFARYISRSRVQQLEFKAPVFISVSVFSYLVFYVLLMIAGILINNMWLWIGIAILPMLGFVSLPYFELFAKTRQRLKILSVEKDQKQDLHKLRSKLTNFIDATLRRGKNAAVKVIDYQ